jgi:hypothetical protein
MDRAITLKILLNTEDLDKSVKEIDKLFGDTLADSIYQGLADAVGSSKSTKLVEGLFQRALGAEEGKPKDMGSILTRIHNVLETGFHKLGDLLQGLATNLSRVAGKFEGVFMGALIQAFGPMGEIFLMLKQTGILTFLSSTGKHLWDWLRHNVLSALATKAKGVITRLWDWGTKEQKEIEGAKESFFGKWKWVVFAVIAFIASIIAFITGLWLLIKSKGKSIWGWILAIFGALGTLLNPITRWLLTQGLQLLLRGLWTIISGFVSWLAGALGVSTGWAWAIIVGALAMIAETIWAVLSPDSFVGFFSKIDEAVARFFIGIYEWLLNLIAKWVPFADQIRAVLEFLKKHASALGKLGAEIGRAILLLSGPLPMTIAIIVKLIQSLAQGKTLWESLKSVIGMYLEIPSRMLKALEPLIRDIDLRAITQASASIKNTIMAIPQKIYQFFTAIHAGVESIILKVVIWIENIRDRILSVYSDIKAKIDSVLMTIKDKITSIFQTVADFFERVHQAFLQNPVFKGLEKMGVHVGHHVAPPETAPVNEIGTALKSPGEVNTQNTIIALLTSLDIQSKKSVEIQEKIYQVSENHYKIIYDQAQNAGTLP